MLAFIQKYKRLVLVTLAVFVLLFAAFTYLSLRAVNDLFETGKVTPTTTQYSEWVGIWLPETVENFQAYGEGWQDWLVEAKFELSSSDLNEFLERNQLQSRELETRLESSYQLEWFTSANALEQYEIKPLSGSAAPTSTGFYPSVWMDTSNPDSVVVYIKANDT
jgi:hypothetical protein